MDMTEERSSTKRTASIQTIHALALVTAVVLAIVATITLARLFNERNTMEESHVRYEQCSEAAQDLMTASDFLTNQVRLYVLTGDEAYLNGYLNEVLHDKNRDFAVETIHAHLKNDDARDRLDTAFGESSNLSKEEMYAMKLVALATGLQQMPQGLSDVAISEQDAALDPDQMRERARVMVLGEEYQANKSRIVQNVDECTTDLIASLQDEEEQSGKRFDSLLVVLRVIVILLAAIVALTFLANYLLMIKPIRMHEQAVRGNNPLPPEGSKELRSFVDSYNQMYEENHRRTMLLKHEAETDPLTGLFNRGSYERLIEETGDDIALVLIDVDLFKNVNDTYGHDTGDKVLKNVAAIIEDNFRTTDYACRIGGDEFAVIMTDMDGVSHRVVERKLHSIAADLHASGLELPTVTLSSGIAFRSEIEPEVDIFRAADKALYQSKSRGRNCYAFYKAEPK
jgi:diguanylate cyclase (GGDEF)-like protein